MGNEQSVPAPPAEDSATSQDPAAAAGDATTDPPNDVTESADSGLLANETDNVEFTDGLPSSSAPIGIPRQPSETRDKRPAFLRRLTTTPSAVLTAQTHAENVTATPTSPSPETALKSVAKKQLDTVSSTRSISATNPSIPDKDSYFPSPDNVSEAKAASQPNLGSENKELAQSPSSLQSSKREQSKRGRWDAPRSGSVSPLSCDLVSNGAPELHDQERDGTESQVMGGIPTPPRETAFDGARPVAFSVDDWAWRMEFLPSEASDDEDDIDPGFFPLPDGDDESFADDELSFLDPGRESALRGESRNEDHSVDLALVRTTSSAESTQRAASLHDVDVWGADAAEDTSSQRDAMTEEEIDDLCNTAKEQTPEETEDDARVEPEAAKRSTNMEEESPETYTVGGVESEDKQSNADEQMDGREETSEEADSQKEVSVAQPPPESPPLDASPRPAQKVIEPDNRRDSAMYQLSLESPREMERLQTIKEPEPADRRKRMSLASIEYVAGELSVADLDSTEQILEPNLSQEEPSTSEMPADAVSSSQEVASIINRTDNDGPAAESQPAEATLVKDDTPEAQIAPVAPKFDISPKRDNLPAADRRPATAHPSRVAAEIDGRPLTAPSNPLQVSEGHPVRQKSKSWRKTWPILGNRAARSKSEASHAEKDPDEILPATPLRPRNPESTQQAQTDGPEQPKTQVADDLSTPSKTSGLVSKIPTPAEQSKAKEKKKRASILGSIFRHSSTKDEKSKSKEDVKPEKDKEKGSKPSKKNSKIAKVYRRSSKRQESGQDTLKESPTSSSRPVTAMAILDAHMVDEPQSLGPSDANRTQGSEGVLKNATEEQRSGSAARGKYGLPSASLGIPTLLHSPAKKKQNNFPDGAWYHRKSVPPQEHAPTAAQLSRRASLGIFAGPDSAEGKRVQGSHLPQARPAQPQNRRASVHVPPQVHLRANPLLPSPDDSPYARASTGIPQPSTSKIFSYPNRNPPYRGIAHANSSPLQGIGSPSQPQGQTPRAGPSRIPSPGLSQVPVGRRSVAPRLPGPHRAVDVRRGNASPTPSQPGLGLAPGTYQSTPDGPSPREKHDGNPETPLKGAGVAISPPEPASSGVVGNSAKGEQSFVAELADTDVGRRASEEITMRATSYPGMEWVPEDME